MPCEPSHPIAPPRTPLTNLTTCDLEFYRLQDAWVAAVLPMVMDPESSCQIRAAQCVYELIIEKVLRWATAFKSLQKARAKLLNSRHRLRENDTDVAKCAESQQQRNTEMASFVSAWQILNRIASAGQCKLLRTCITVLIRQGIIKASNAMASTATGALATKTTMKELVAAVKLACCFCMDGVGGSHSFRAGEPMSPTSSPLPRSGAVLAKTQWDNSSGDIAALRDGDPEDVSKAGWVILEALIGQQDLHSTSSPRTDSTDDEGSATFVVRCFMRKREMSKPSQSPTPSPASKSPRERVVDDVRLDDDDMRILRVMEQLADSLTDTDISTMRGALLPLLLALGMTAQNSSAVLAVMFALSRARAKRSSEEAVDETMGADEDRAIDDAGKMAEESDHDDDSANNDLDDEENALDESDNEGDDDDEEFGPSGRRRNGRRGPKRRAASKSQPKSKQAARSHKAKTCRQGKESDNAKHGSDMSPAQLSYWYKDVQQWAGQLLSVIKQVLEAYVWQGQGLSQRDGVDDDRDDGLRLPVVALSDNIRRAMRYPGHSFFLSLC